MRRVLSVPTTSAPQSTTEETVTSTVSKSTVTESSNNNNDDDTPPVIQRYDNTIYPPASTPPQSTAAPQRVVYSQRPTTSQTNGKVLLIRRNDGTTQYLRPVPAKDASTRTVTITSTDSNSAGQPVRRIVASVGARPGTIVRTVSAPTRVVRLGPDGQQIMSTIPAGSRIVTTRVGDTGNTITAQSFRRPVQRQNLYSEPDYGPRGIQQGYGRHLQRVVRGGATMAMGQRITQNDYRYQPLVTGARAIKRSYLDYMRVPAYPARPYRFDFESNEDEERAIAEAIEQEEERMRQEEEETRRDQERQWNHPRIIDKYGQIGSTIFQPLNKQQPLQYSSNLMPLKDDTPEQKQIKQTLDSLITQVCRWDKQYGWFKAHQKRPKNKVEIDKLKTRRMFSNQREVMLAEHVERLRREINKRRTKLENDAEVLCGLPTPWRKSKSKSQKEEEDWQKFGWLLDCGQSFSDILSADPLASEDEAIVFKAKSRNQSQDIKKSVTEPTSSSAPLVNPAEISLGGDSIEWGKKEIKKEEEDELVEDVSQPSVKRARIETEENNGSSPRRKAIVPKSDRVLRTRVNSHSSVEESLTKIEQPKKRGRPRKEATQVVIPSDDSDGDGVDHGVPEGMNNPDDPHCICKKPYNSRRFYISCDLCSGWFHGKCVGVKSDDCATMTSWFCPPCIEEQQKADKNQQLYCVCKKPYDDRLFYVGCDRCEDWFHPGCVGITKEYAETIAEYLCPKCSTEVENDVGEGYESANSETSTLSNSPPLSRNDYPKVWKLLQTIIDHRMAWPFKEPVDPKKYPGYSDVVKKPIDLTNISNKLERLEYIKLSDFSRDMIQMFENAKSFYPKDSPVYLCATTLEKIFEQQLQEVKGEMVNRLNIDRRKPSESHTVDSSLDIDTDQLIEADIDSTPFDISQYI